MPITNQFQEKTWQASPVPAIITGEHALEFAVTSSLQQGMGKVFCRIDCGVSKQIGAWIRKSLPKDAVVITDPSTFDEVVMQQSQAYPVVVSCNTYGPATGSMEKNHGGVNISVPCSMPYSGSTMPRPDAHTDILVVDPGITACMAPAVVAASTGPLLLDIAACCLVMEDPVALCWLESACSHIMRHEQAWNGPTSMESWEHISHDAMVGQVLASFASGKRGSSTILEFAESLVVPGISTLQQTSHALLIPFLQVMQAQHKQAFDTLATCLGGRNPIQAAHVWSLLSETGEQEERIRTLCSQVFHVFEYAQVVRELRPLLTGIEGHLDLGIAQTTGEVSDV